MSCVETTDKTTPKKGNERYTILQSLSDVYIYISHLQEIVIAVLKGKFPSC